MRTNSLNPSIKHPPLVISKLRKNDITILQDIKIDVLSEKFQDSVST
jgi:hypothetical protein